MFQRPPHHAAHAHGPPFYAPDTAGGVEIFGAGQSMDSIASGYQAPAVAAIIVGESDAVQPDQLIPRSASLVHAKHEV